MTSLSQVREFAKWLGEAGMGGLAKRVRYCPQVLEYSQVVILGLDPRALYLPMAPPSEKPSGQARG